MNKEKEKIFLNQLYNEGLVGLQNKNLKLAIEKFEKILSYRPKNSQILNLNCIAHYQFGNLNKALNLINKAIKYDKNESGFYINLGNILKDLNSFSASKKAYNNAIKINKNSVEAFYNIGVIYTIQRDYNSAIYYYKKAIKINPKYKYALDNLGSTYCEIGDYNKAKKFFKKTISIDTNFNQAHYNLSFVLLLTGSYKIGWEKYEYRLKKKTYNKNLPFLNYKYWDGSKLKNKSLLIYCEQGIGDSIHFARYIKCIKKNNTKIILFCSNSVIIFFKNFFEIDLIISSQKEIPKIDYYISMMSLPYIFRKNTNLPKTYKFIKSDKDFTHYWKSKINTSKKIKVGLAWQGDHIHYYGDYKRSIALEKMKPILELEKIKFISLQKGFGREQIKLNGFEKFIFDFYNNNIDQTPFKDTISIIENLDLVLTVDTVFAHIAATLGKETWILLAFVPDFRWGLIKSKTNWYNNVTLFRQKKINEWDNVILEVKNKLIKKFSLNLI